MEEKVDKTMDRQKHFQLFCNNLHINNNEAEEVGVPHMPLRGILEFLQNATPFCQTAMQL